MKDPSVHLAVSLLLAGTSVCSSASQKLVRPFQSASTAVGAVESNPRSETSLDPAWRFHWGEAAGADQSAFDDSTWRTVDLPHDWSIEGPPGTNPPKIEGPFDWNSPAGAGGGYLNGGIGWYRKTFTLPPSAKAKHVAVLFDGAYMNSDVWLNGQHLGTHPYGFTSFSYDLTPDLNYGVPNVLSVRLELKQPCCRWYSGAGLYRNVWLIQTDQLHVEQWGTFVTTQKVGADFATVRVQTQVANDGAHSDNATLSTTIFAPDGHEVTTVNTDMTAPNGTTQSEDQSLSIPFPQLWSVDAPNLYTAVSEVRSGSKLRDKVTTTFGIRTIEFTKENGFLLNGKRVEIHGVCDHHDLGCLGSVALRRGFERQLQILKSMGCNGIRTSHNPPSPDLLDLCDRMGFLVMDEAFDEWQKNKTKNGYGLYFNDWSQKDLVSMLHRDRNHPSIIIWSTGNEVTEGFQGGGSAVAQPLIDTCHREDPTRPVTSACQQPGNSLRYGFDKVFDVFGANYSPGSYEDPRAHGLEPILGSETSSQVDTRGEYGLKLDAGGNVTTDARPNGQVSCYDLFRPGWAQTPDTEELALKRDPWVAGEYIWTGFDYIGEPTPYGWPARSSYFGINDLCGFPKDRYYFYKSQWTTDPVVHILPHWTWPGFEGKNIPVWVFTNADTVELFLNGQSLGVKHFPADCETLTVPSSKSGATPQSMPTLHLAWNVPYSAGELRAVATKDGKPFATDVERTAGAPAAILISPDRATIIGDGKDLSYLKLSIVDANGTLCPNADNELHFSLSGTAATLAGLDDGDPTNHEAFQGTQHKAFHGLALAVLRSRTGGAGQVALTVTADGLPEARTVVVVK